MKPEPDHKEQPLGDVYDLYDMATKVHKEGSQLSRDFTLADTSSEQVINGKLPKFIREQVKIIRIISNYLGIPDTYKEEVTQHEEEEGGEIIIREEKKRVPALSDELTEEISKVTFLLFEEIHTMITLTRAEGGRLLKAILLVGRNREEVAEYEQGAEPPTTKEKLTTPTQ